MAQHRVCGSNTVCIQDLTYIISLAAPGLRGFSKRALAERSNSRSGRVPDRVGVLNALPRRNTRSFLPRQSFLVVRSAQFSNDLCFPLAIRPAIGMEYFMKPDGRRVHDVRLLPGIPRQISLRFAGDQPPVDRGYVVLLRDG